VKLQALSTMVRIFCAVLLACLFTNIGFLHGAYYEGLYAGEEIAKCIANGGCAGLQHVDNVANASPYPYASIIPS
jgi:polyamine oxidase